jgi:tetratricopeptide (TPR) repeat protein
LEISNEAHEDSLKNYHAAQENFAEAIKIQNETSASAFPIELDLMETVHLIGVRNTKQKAYQAAIAFLLEAIKMEKDFNTTTGAIHFLTYISMQSLGEAYLLNNENENALKILNETLEAQIAFYAKREHTDIAKTLHFVGMAHHNQKEYLLALTALHEALDIKEKLLKANDFMITVTENELIKAYNGDFDFDWNNSLTIESNRQKISRLEDFLKRIDSKRQLNSEDALAYGQLCYKLGTFHVQAHFAEVKEAAEHARSQSKPAEVSALTSFPGTLYGRTQSPRVADFAGTSVAMPLVNNSATPTPTPEEMLSVSTISGLTNTL